MRNGRYDPSNDPESHRDLSPPPGQDGHFELPSPSSNPDNNNDNNNGLQRHPTLKEDEPKGRSFGVSAVIVRNANKSYKKLQQPVLNNFSMTVKSGTIYSLLGSSGCGKTTLLSCCVGLSRVESGDIRVFGAPPGTKESGIPGRMVGYMPQELSLYVEFTIEESFMYFGQLYSMSRSKIISSMEFLLKLIELPKASRLVKSLSGGQKRRVSFALAIFHNPSLLILDEPTVGVDPLLRESIWNHLCDMVSKRKTTVIITTHYIEEARQSHTVGVMRNGRLLVEKSPEELMEEHGVPLLEQVVLQLCRKDNDQISGINKPVNDLNKTVGALSTSPVKEKINHGQGATPLKFLPLQDPWKDSSGGKNSKNGSEYSSWKQRGGSSSGNSWKQDFLDSVFRLKALTFKNFLVLIRNIWFLVFIFLVPSIQVILICVAIGPEPKNLNFGVVNYERDDYNLSHPICEPVENCTSPYYLSCRYLQLLPNQSIKLMGYKREEDALLDIEKGRLWGYISFPANYSFNVMERALFRGISSELSNDTLDGSKIGFQMDMSNKQIGQTAQKIFFDVYQSFVRETALDCEADPREGEIPLNFKTPVYGSDETSFSEFMAPSVLMGLLFFFPLCSSGISYISENKSGTLARSLVAGVTSLEIMVSYLISQIFVLVGQSGLAFLIFTLVFKIEIMGSTLLAISLCVVVGIAGMSMGFLIASVCKEEIQAVLLAIGSFLPNLLLAGMVWPIEGMPMSLRYIGYLLPCTMACESMRSIVTRGWPITHPSVWYGFVSSIAWTFIYWIVTIILHRFSNKK